MMKPNRDEQEPFFSRRGRSLAIRAVRSEDLPAVAAMLCGLSQRTVERRYLASRVFSKAAAVDEAARITRHGDDRVVLVAHTAGDASAIVAVGELVRDRAEPAVAEGAMLVADAYQGEGIGRALLERLAHAAEGAAINRVRATVSALNRPMRRLLASLGTPYRARAVGGEVQYEFGA
jgi:GNAT superfamily N-acetyltransferase